MQRKRRRRFARALRGPGALLLAAFVAVACACGSRSSSPKEKKRQILLETEAHDEKVGLDAATAVRAEMGFVERPELHSYVQEIGRRLLRYAPRRGFNYTFDLVDQDAPNAFALPGGHIFLSRGLLVLANSEDELANVLGHEIIHVAARHAAARQSAVRSLPGPFQFYAMRELASYGRDQEREADRLGQGLSALAGYSPQGMATFLRDLEYLERLQLGMSRLPSFFDTHPATTERVATAGGRARVISWERQPPIAGDRAGYLRRIEGLTVGPSAREGVFQGDRFLHADLGFSMRFPDRWNVVNTTRAVGAMSPQRDAQVFLEHQGLGHDPKLSADEYLKEAGDQGFRLEAAKPIKIGGFDAYRAEGRASAPGPGGSIRVMFTWVAYNSTIYRITGVAVSARYEPSFINVARSFRPLTAQQRASIRENRLRIVVAREGESLEQISQRAGNQWNVQQTAIMNDLFANQSLRANQLVKVAVSQLYVPK
jgi:predicted Zn-dependent protease